MFRFTVKVRPSTVLNGFQRSFFKSAENPSTDLVVEDDSNEFISNSNYTAEEIDRMRDKSRLPKEIKKRYLQEQMPTLERPHLYESHHLRRLYGKFGKQSGLNPGLCWPTPDELEYKMEYKNLAYLPLQELVKIVKQRNNNESNAKMKREKMVEENLKKLLTTNKEIEQLEAQKEAEASARRKKNEELVNEVREFFGYNLNANDPRVRDLIQKRQDAKKAEEKEALKSKVKKKFGKKVQFNYVKQVKVLSQSIKKVKIKEESDSDDD